MKKERLGTILAGLAIVLRGSAAKQEWLTTFASYCGELDGAQWQRDAAEVVRGIADQCDEKADLVFPLDRPRYTPKKGRKVQP